MRPGRPQRQGEIAATMTLSQFLSQPDSHRHDMTAIREGIQITPALADRFCNEPYLATDQVFHDIERGTLHGAASIGHRLNLIPDQIDRT
jgi:hypothetical protein